MRSIREIAQKIKWQAHDLLQERAVALVVILAVLGAFYLGRLSVIHTQKSPTDARLEGLGGLERVGAPESWVVMASRSGSVYYFPWCSQVGRIPESELLKFASPSEAQAAGYRPAQNCKGLEQKH